METMRAGAQTHGDGFRGNPPAGGFAPGAMPNSNRQFGGAGNVGVSQTGQAGVLRLFRAPLGKEAGWLLPFGVSSAGLLALGSRPRWPLGERHRALWSGAAGS